MGLQASFHAAPNISAGNESGSYIFVLINPISDWVPLLIALWRGVDSSNQNDIGNMMANFFLLSSS